MWKLWGPFINQWFFFFYFSFYILCHLWFFSPCLVFCFVLTTPCYHQNQTTRLLLLLLSPPYTCVYLCWLLCWYRYTIPGLVITYSKFLLSSSFVLCVFWFFHFWWALLLFRHLLFFVFFIFMGYFVLLTTGGVMRDRRPAFFLICIRFLCSFDYVALCVLLFGTSLLIFANAYFFFVLLFCPFFYFFFYYSNSAQSPGQSPDYTHAHQWK